MDSTNITFLIQNNTTPLTTTVSPPTEQPSSDLSSVITTLIEPLAIDAIKHYGPILSKTVSNALLLGATTLVTRSTRTIAGALSCIATTNAMAPYEDAVKWPLELFKNTNENGYKSSEKQLKELSDPVNTLGANDLETLTKIIGQLSLLDTRYFNHEETVYTINRFDECVKVFEKYWRTAPKNDFFKRNENYTFIENLYRLNNIVKNTLATLKQKTTDLRFDVTIIKTELKVIEETVERMTSIIQKVTVTTIPHTEL